MSYSPSNLSADIFVAAVIETGLLVELHENIKHVDKQKSKNLKTICMRNVELQKWGKKLIANDFIMVNLSAARQNVDALSFYVGKLSSSTFIIPLDLYLRR